MLSLKNIKSKDQNVKALYSAQGHRDRDKPCMVHEIATLRSSSIHMILSVTAIKSLRVFSHDVNQAYVQSKDKVSRRIFILPKQEYLDILCITDNEFLELLRPIYGVCNAGDYWGVTVHYHVEKGLDMSPTTGDPGLYLKLSDGKLEGMVGISSTITCIQRRRSLRREPSRASRSLIPSPGSMSTSISLGKSSRL